MEISSLDDIQKLEAKDPREILKSNLKSTGWVRADLVLKVYALLMQHVLPSSSGENQELLTDVQDLEQNQSDFRYKVTMVRISALGWASNLRIYLRWISVSFTITLLFHENIATSCWEECITGSTTEAVQYGLESEAKAVAL